MIRPERLKRYGLGTESGLEAASSAGLRHLQVTEEGLRQETAKMWLLRAVSYLL